MTENETNLEVPFVVAEAEDGKIYAHRPAEPAFLVECESKEQAKEVALDIITDYIRKFCLVARSATTQKL